jgi:ATP-binding cassette subfamily B protein
VEYINGIQVIKVFGKTKSSYDRFVHDAYEAAHSFIDWMRASILPMTFAMVVMPSTMVSVLPIGGILVKKGSLSPQDFVMIIILSVGLITPFVTLMSYSDDLRTMGTIFGEVRAILDAPEMVRPETGNVPEKNDLELKDVHFSYHTDADTEVLHGVSMKIPEGSFAALVGPSGSGKSTIARLIAALWDIRDIPQEAYADKVAFVSQDNYLFNMTVRENIRLGRPSATDEEVEEAAKMSGCHDFILSLEKGYDTMVGSSGGHLSGGERQRISIARAMMKDAPVIFLDEATANVDPENENDLMRAIQALTEEKTVIMIAHRLKTVEHADQILVVDHGKIVQQGTHGNLMKEEGIYRNFISERREAASWKVKRQC